jgi:poly(A) polymerase
VGLQRRPADLRLLRWSLLLHDVSKPETLEIRSDGRPSFHAHEVLGARRAEALLGRLRVARADRRRVSRLIRLHLRPGLLSDAGAPPRGLRRLVRDAEGDLPLLVLHTACDAVASGGPDATRRWRKLRGVLRTLLEMDQRRRLTPLPRLVDGRDVLRLLGLEPGPAVGRILAKVREAQEEGAIRTRSDALVYVRTLSGDGGSAL